MPESRNDASAAVPESSPHPRRRDAGSAVGRRLQAWDYRPGYSCKAPARDACYPPQPGRHTCRRPPRARARSDAAGPRANLELQLERGGQAARVLALTLSAAKGARSKKPYEPTLVTCLAPELQPRATARRASFESRPRAIFRAGVGRVRRRHETSAHAEPLLVTTPAWWGADDIACTGRSFLAAGGRNRKGPARYQTRRSRQRSLI
jgi:hypothetical protein